MDLSGKFSWWWFHQSEFHFEVVHRVLVTSQEADALPGSPTSLQFSGRGRCTCTSLYHIGGKWQKYRTECESLFGIQWNVRADTSYPALFEGLRVSDKINNEPRLAISKLVTEQESDPYCKESVHTLCKPWSICSIGRDGVFARQSFLHTRTLYLSHNLEFSGHLVERPFFWQASTSIFFGPKGQYGP